MKGSRATKEPEQKRRRDTEYDRGERLTPEEKMALAMLAQRVAIQIEAGRLMAARQLIDEHAAPLDPLLASFEERLAMTLAEVCSGGRDVLIKATEALALHGVITCRDFLDREETDLVSIFNFSHGYYLAILTRLAELGMRPVRG